MDYFIRASYLQNIEKIIDKPVVKVLTGIRGYRRFWK